jgi:hypothetical protein
MTKHIITTTSLLVSIFVTNNGMEPIHINNNKNIVIVKKLNNTERLQIIYKSEKLLTKITKKETLLLNPINSKTSSTKKETIQDLIFFREALNENLRIITIVLNENLKSLTIKTYDQQIDNITTNQKQLRQKTKNIRDIQKELKLSIKTYQFLLQEYLTILKETQQAQHLTERGLMIYEHTQILPLLDSQYELTKQISNELFLDIQDLHLLLTTPLTSYIEKLSNEQETLIVESNTTQKRKIKHFLF